MSRYSEQRIKLDFVLSLVLNCIDQFNRLHQTDMRLSEEPAPRLLHRLRYNGILCGLQLYLLLGGQEFATEFKNIRSQSHLKGIETAVILFLCPCAYTLCLSSSSALTSKNDYKSGQSSASAHSGESLPVRPIVKKIKENFAFSLFLIAELLG